MRTRKFLLLVLFIALTPISAQGDAEKIPYMPGYSYEDALESVQYLQKFITGAPEIAIVSGSGLGGIAGILKDKVIIDSTEIPQGTRNAGCQVLHSY